MSTTGLLPLCPAPWTKCRSALPSSPAIVAGSRGAAARKHAERLLSSLRSISDEETAPSAVDKRVRKFFISTPKTAALSTLSLLLSDCSSSLSLQAALSLYRRITAAPWFTWNSTLAASVVPCLDEMGLSSEAESVILEAESKLKHRELSIFYSNLIEAYAKRGSREKVFEISSRRMSPGKLADESTAKALCLLDSPSEAEEILRAMEAAGLPASPFCYRLVLQSYGRSGMFPEMKRAFEAMISTGIPADTVSSNVILSCYGARGMLAEMVTWLKQMRDSGVPYSIRTCNSALNPCTHLLSLLQDHQMLPTTLEGLIQKLEEREASLVREIASSEVLLEAMEWTSSEGKMDVHGYHLSSAFVALLQWIHELKRRFLQGETMVPREISIVCGSGKHSGTMGESPVKKMVCVALYKMGSPLRVDRKNVGRLVGGGRAVREWLLRMEGS